MVDSGIEYRILVEDDWQQWKALRLEALRDYPISFSASYDEEKNKDDAHFKANLTSNRMFGAFIDGKLVSTVGLLSYNLMNKRHRGLVIAVYTTPSARGKGITKVLIELVIEEARRLKMVLLQLDVAIGNDAAIKLYEKLGFRVIGTELRSMIVGNEYVDQYLMAVNID